MLADSSRESFAILSLPWNLHRSLVVLALFLQESATWQSRTSSLATGQLDSLKLPKLYILWRYNQMYDLFRILFKVHKNYFPRSLRQFLPSTSSLIRQKWHRNHPPLRTPSNLAWIISEDSLSDYYFRRQSECAEAEHGDDGPRRPAGAEDQAEILHQGGEQTNQIVSHIFILVTRNNCF